MASALGLQRCLGKVTSHHSATIEIDAGKALTLFLLIQFVYINITGRMLKFLLVSICIDFMLKLQTDVMLQQRIHDIDRKILT